MEEDRKQIPHGECPRQLNLNVPLLSTRRPFGLSSSLAHSNNASSPMDATNMVPFSWERIPGEPKDMETDRGWASLDVTPPPKLPPGRWQPIATEEASCSTAAGPAVNQCCHGSGSSEGDCGDKDYGDGERCCSDAIDIFSLAESTSGEDMEDNCRAGTQDGQSALVESDYNGCHSPSFMMRRFLPDAQALAVASVMNKAHPLPSDPTGASSNFSRAVSIRRSYHSPKGCGLGLSSFFPWRMKHKPCSVKSPICNTIIGPNRKQNS